MTRNDFKKKMLSHVVNIMPDGFVIVQPNHTDEDTVGLPEWAELMVRHAPVRRVALSQAGKHRHEYSGTVTLDVRLPQKVGDKRSDELAQAWVDGLVDRTVAGLPVNVQFNAVQARETGNRPNSNHNGLLCEAIFSYWHKK